MSRLYAALSWAIVALGVLHMVTTFSLARSTPSFRVWFFGAGITLVLVGALNLIQRNYGHSARGLRIVCRGANLFVLLYAIVAGAVTHASLVEYIVITGLVGGSCILSFVRFGQVP